MNRWDRVNLLLAVVAVLLLALLYRPHDEGAAQRLTTLDPDTVRSLRIERGNRLVLALQRDGAQWQLTHPYAADAVSQRVEQLLAITRAPVLHRLSADSDPGGYGLAEPRATLQLDTLRIAFGDRDPTQRGRYVQVDDALVLIDDLWFNLLTLPVRHFAAD